MATELHREPWNKGIIVGQKAPLKLMEVGAIHMRLQLARRQQELALFNPGVDCKLRACDLVQLRVKDIFQHVNTPESFIVGSWSWVRMPPRTERTR